MKELDGMRVLNLLNDPESQFAKGNGKTTAMLYVLLRTIAQYKNVTVLIPSEHYSHALNERDCAIWLAEVLGIKVVNEAAKENKVVLDIEGEDCTILFITDTTVQHLSNLISNQRAKIFNYPTALKIYHEEIHKL